MDEHLSQTFLQTPSLLLLVRWLVATEMASMEKVMLLMNLQQRQQQIAADLHHTQESMHHIQVCFGVAHHLWKPSCAHILKPEVFRNECL
jgi:hypothetical protein